MAENGTVYYAQVGWDRTPENPYNVLRKLHPDNEVVELYDRTTGTWIERLGLARYTHGGKDGANVITKAQAETVIGSWAY